jgi:hypothetical protein
MPSWLQQTPAADRSASWTLTWVIAAFLTIHSGALPPRRASLLRAMPLRSRLLPPDHGEPSPA